MRHLTPSLVLASLSLAAVLIGASCSSFSDSPESSHNIAVRRTVAKGLLGDVRVGLANFHVSGKSDEATAFDNVQQAAAGAASRRSQYGRAPGGWVYLDNRMLKAMETLAKEGFSFRVTELAGGSHSPKSNHYTGGAFDIDYLNGVKVGSGNPGCRRFMQRCLELGAREVKGPGDPGHRTHIHAAW